VSGDWFRAAVSFVSTLDLSGKSPAYAHRRDYKVRPPELTARFVFKNVISKSFPGRRRIELRLNFPRRRELRF
jgi:hypothetical protein